jgi:hypothetical protein
VIEWRTGRFARTGRSSIVPLLDDLAVLKVEDDSGVRTHRVAGRERVQRHGEHTLLDRRGTAWEYFEPKLRALLAPDRLAANNSAADSAD